jgi:hypothetical protein
LFAAMVMHDAASPGSTLAIRPQHVIRPAQLPPLAEPPSPPVPPLVLAPLPPHADEHFCASQVKTGDSHVVQLLIWQASSCEEHIIWMQLTHDEE